jgi:hypothetical protein
MSKLQGGGILLPDILEKLPECVKMQASPPARGLVIINNNK